MSRDYWDFRSKKCRVYSDQMGSVGRIKLTIRLRVW
jgi:hypothetical protein